MPYASGRVRALIIDTTGTVAKVGPDGDGRPALRTQDARVADTLEEIALSLQRLIEIGEGT